MKIKKETLTKEEFDKLFYNPAIGLIGLDKFYTKVKEIKPNVSIADVEKYYKEQELTQVMKRQLRPKKFNTMFALYPGNIYEIDFIVYQRYEINHYKYIFCCIDIYSRFALAIPTTNMTMTTILDCIKKVIKEMGKPDIFKGDNQFNKIQFITFCKDHDIGVQFSDPDELNKNPIVERFNGTLGRNLNILRIVLKNPQWYKYLSNVVENYNTTIHSTTKQTPVDIFTGKEINNQPIIRIEPMYKIGDAVRLVFKKKIFNKGSEISHSSEIYTITNIKKNRYELNNGKLYKEYELTPANTVYFTPDMDNYKGGLDKELSQDVNLYKKKKIKSDVEADLIIEGKRDKERKDYKMLNSKGN